MSPLERVVAVPTDNCLYEVTSGSYPFPASTVQKTRPPQILPWDKVKHILIGNGLLDEEGSPTEKAMGCCPPNWNRIQKRELLHLLLDPYVIDPNSPSHVARISAVIKYAQIMGPRQAFDRLDRILCKGGTLHAIHKKHNAEYYRRLAKDLCPEIENDVDILQLFLGEPDLAPDVDWTIEATKADSGLRYTLADLMVEYHAIRVFNRFPLVQENKAVKAQVIGNYIDINPFHKRNTGPINPNGDQFFVLTAGKVHDVVIMTKGKRKCLFDSTTINITPIFSLIKPTTNGWGWLKPNKISLVNELEDLFASLTEDQLDSIEIKPFGIDQNVIPSLITRLTKCRAIQNPETCGRKGWARQIFDQTRGIYLTDPKDLIRLLKAVVKEVKMPDGTVNSTRLSVLLASTLEDAIAKHAVQQHALDYIAVGITAINALTEASGSLLYITPQVKNFVWFYLSNKAKEFEIHSLTGLNQFLLELVHKNVGYESVLLILQLQAITGMMQPSEGILWTNLLSAITSNNKGYCASVILKASSICLHVSLPIDIISTVRNLARTIASEHDPEYLLIWNKALRWSAESLLASQYIADNKNREQNLQIAPYLTSLNLDFDRIQQNLMDICHQQVGEIKFLSYALLVQCFTYNPNVKLLEIIISKMHGIENKLEEQTRCQLLYKCTGSKAELVNSHGKYKLLLLSYQHLNGQKPLYPFWSKFVNTLTTSDIFYILSLEHYSLEACTAMLGCTNAERLENLKQYAPFVPVEKLKVLKAAWMPRTIREQATTPSITFDLELEINNAYSFIEQQDCEKLNQWFRNPHIPKIKMREVYKATLVRGLSTEQANLLTESSPIHLKRDTQLFIAWVALEHYLNIHKHNIKANTWDFIFENYMSKLSLMGVSPHITSEVCPIYMACGEKILAQKQINITPFLDYLLTEFLNYGYSRTFWQSTISFLAAAHNSPHLDASSHTKITNTLIKHLPWIETAIDKIREVKLKLSSYKMLLDWSIKKEMVYKTSYLKKTIESTPVFSEDELITVHTYAYEYFSKLHSVSEMSIALRLFEHCYDAKIKQMYDWLKCLLPFTASLQLSYFQFAKFLNALTNYLLISNQSSKEILQQLKFLENLMTPFKWLEIAHVLKMRNDYQACIMALSYECSNNPGVVAQEILPLLSHCIQNEVKVPENIVVMLTQLVDKVSLPTYKEWTQLFMLLKPHSLSHMMATKVWDYIYQLEQHPLGDEDSESKFEIWKIGIGCLSKKSNEFKSSLLNKNSIFYGVLQSKAYPVLMRSNLAFYMFDKILPQLGLVTDKCSLDSSLAFKNENPSPIFDIEQRLKDSVEDMFYLFFTLQELALSVSPVYPSYFELRFWRDSQRTLLHHIKYTSLWDLQHDDYKKIVLNLYRAKKILKDPKKFYVKYNFRFQVEFTRTITIDACKYLYAYKQCCLSKGNNRKKEKYVDKAVNAICKLFSVLENTKKTFGRARMIENGKDLDIEDIYFWFLKDQKMFELVNAAIKDRVPLNLKQKLLLAHCFKKHAPFSPYVAKGGLRYFYLAIEDILKQKKPKQYRREIEEIMNYYFKFGFFFEIFSGSLLPRILWCLGANSDALGISKTAIEHWESSFQKSFPYHPFRHMDKQPTLKERFC